MSGVGTRAATCDRILASLFKKGQSAPSAAALRDAYPFGERKYHPYKVWLARVKVFRAMHAKLNAGESIAADFGSAT